MVNKKTELPDAKRMRHNEAVKMIRDASSNSVEQMANRGWHRCSEVLDEDAATLEVEDQLGDPDYSVEVTKTCSGFIVWTALTDRT